MRILVLGGDGFIGSHFVDRAVALRHAVTVFDRFADGVSRNLEHQRGAIEMVAGEFANRDDLVRALRGQEIVCHFVTTTNPASSWLDPFVEIETNLKQSVQLCELAQEAGVKKIVFPSSGGAVYGRRSGVLREEHAPLPFNPYGITKLAIEHFMNYFRERSGLAADIYRIGNAYGPRQPMTTPQGVIAVWMGRILAGREIMVYGDRETLRDYVYVGDVARLMAHSLDDPGSSGVYNLGTGRGVSISELFEIFTAAIDGHFRHEVLARRGFDATSVILDSSRLLAYFPGFAYQTLEDGIRETWRHVEARHAGQPRETDRDSPGSAGA